MAARFITFEGVEGSGKSTQLAELARRLRAARRRVVVTREPGGTPAGGAIRRIFLGPAGRGLEPWTELFLIEAARAQHLAEVVRPALEAAAIVLCDRFTDSTLAYQGDGRGLPLASIRTLHRLPSLRPLSLTPSLLKLVSWTTFAPLSRCWRIVPRRSEGGCWTTLTLLASTLCPMARSPSPSRLTCVRTSTRHAW